MIATNLQPLGKFKISFTNVFLKILSPFTVSVDLPSMTLTQVPTSFRNEKGFVPGETVTYDSLNIRIALDAAGVVYSALYKWMIDCSLKKKGSESDLAFTMIDSKNNPSRIINFTNVFPMSIGSSQFNTQNQDVEYAYCDLTLSYDKMIVL